MSHCVKHGTRGVDESNQCPACEEEREALMDPEPQCFKCVHFRVSRGIRDMAECELKHKLEPSRCGAYMREIGSEG
jgi:hypothetical protein